MAKKKKVEPAWHPNFRDPEALPDIKVVRTDFAFNLIACALAFALLGLVGFNEYTAMSLGSEVSKLESKRTALRGPDSKSITISNNFAKQAERVGQVAEFMEQPASISKLLVEVANIIPEDMLLSSFAYSLAMENVTKGKKKSRVRIRRIQIRGNVTGNPESAPELVDDFRQDLLELPTIKPHIDTIKLASLERDDTLDVFNYTLDLTFKPLDPASLKEAAKQAKK